MQYHVTHFPPYCKQEFIMRDLSLWWHEWAPLCASSLTGRNKSVHNTPTQLPWTLQEPVSLTWAHTPEKKIPLHTTPRAEVLKKPLNLPAPQLQVRPARQHAALRAQGSNHFPSAVLTPCCNYLPRRGMQGCKSFVIICSHCLTG